MRKLTFIIITSVCVLIFAFSSPNPKNYMYIKELKEMTYNDNEYHLNKITLNNLQSLPRTPLQTSSPRKFDKSINSNINSA